MMYSQPSRPQATSAKAGSALIVERELLRDLVEALGGDTSELRDAPVSVSITLRRVRQGATLLYEGAPAKTVYVLRSGSLKCARTLEDGYEQVLSFAQPGELLGFEALYCGHQPISIVALEDVSAYALPMIGLQVLRQECAALDQAVQMALSRQLVCAAGTAEMMAAAAADARLARFLLWLSARMAEAGRSPRRLLLRMCRRDIASLLGVAHETVSRSFAALAGTGYVKVDNRNVEILDLNGLRILACSTRRPIEEAARLAGQLPPRERAAALPMTWFPQAAARSPSLPPEPSDGLDRPGHRTVRLGVQERAVS